MQATAQQAAARRQVEALRNAAELRQMLSGLAKVDDEGRRGSLLDALCAVDDILSLPMRKNPPGITSGELKVNLLKHQVSGFVDYRTRTWADDCFRGTAFAESGAAMVCGARVSNVAEGGDGQAGAVLAAAEEWISG
jgi:hypothetical protein